jgi:ribokinase
LNVAPPNKPWLTFMGSFIADLTFRAETLPAWGQTVLGSGFRIGAGGKGSNQAVAAARLGARVCVIGRLGRDTFGELARRTWAAEGIDTTFCTDTADHGTGAAAVILHAAHGDNAIVVDPGSGMHLTSGDVDAAAQRIAASAVFVTQLELSPAVVERALGIARNAGVVTILNPAPALALSADVYPLCDYLTPNESEAEGLVGFPVSTVADAARAADLLLARGAKNVIVTLGENGALAMNGVMHEHIVAFRAGAVVETTGAGDAFNGALAVGLSEGMGLVEATRFGCAAGGLSVTKAGTSESMPARVDVERLRTADG